MTAYTCAKKKKKNTFHSKHYTTCSDPELLLQMCKRSSYIKSNSSLVMIWKIYLNSRPAREATLIQIYTTILAEIWPIFMIVNHVADIFTQSDK